MIYAPYLINRYNKIKKKINEYLERNTAFGLVKKFFKSGEYKRFFTSFLIQGLFYLDCEIVFRAMMGALVGLGVKPYNWSYGSLVGWTSLWMFFVGGMSGALLGALNEVAYTRNRLNVFWQSVVGTAACLSLELASGVILNNRYGLGVWHYAGRWQYANQISLPFGVLWLAMCPASFWVDDMIRSLLFGQGRPYGLLTVYKSWLKPWESPKIQPSNFTRISEEIKPESSRVIPVTGSAAM